MALEAQTGGVKGAGRVFFSAATPVGIHNGAAKRPRARAALIALGFGLILASPAQGGENACAATVTKQLAALQIDPADVRQVSYILRTQSRREGGKVIGLDAWVSLRNCRGALVLAMSPFCQLRQTYSRGECRIPGVKDC